jgi:flagellin
LPVVSSNRAADVSLFCLNNNIGTETSTLSKIASGSRIVNASDDAAGLAIGSQLAAGVAVMQQDAVNVQQGRSLLQIADAGLTQIAHILSRMMALAAESSSGQVTDTQRVQDLDTEYQQLAQQINIVTSSTQYAGASLLNFTGAGGNAFSWNSSSVLSGFYLAQQATDAQGPLSAAQAAALATYTTGIDGLPTGTSGTFNATPYESGPAYGPSNFLIGTSSAATISVSLNAVNTITLGLEQDVVSYSDQPDTNYGTMPNPGYNPSLPTGPGNEPSIPATFAYWQSLHPGEALLGNVNTTVVSTKSNVASQSAALIAMSQLSSALATVNQEQATVGAYESRFDFANQTIGENMQNTSAAVSVVMDADVAAEKARLTAENVKTQSAVAALSQAAQLPTELLKLIQFPSKG